MLKQISNPFSVFDIGFPPWNRFDMLGVDDKDLHMLFQQVVNGLPENPGTFARVRAVRLSVLLRQVSLLSPQNRPDTFQRSRLARFPCAYVCSPITFPYAVRHGTGRKAPLFCVGVASSDVPKGFSLKDFLTYVHDGLPSFPLWFHTIRIGWHKGVFPVQFDFCTSWLLG